MNARAHIAAAVGLFAFTAGAVDVNYGVGVRTDVRGRTPLPGDVSSTGVTSDLQLDPRGEVTLGFGLSSLGLQYTPQLLWREPQTGGRLLTLQRGRLAFGHRWSRAQLVVAQEGAWGQQDFGALRTDGDALTQVGEIQTFGGIPYVRSASLASLDTQPFARGQLNFDVGFIYQGSPERPDALPVQWGPRANASLRLGVSHVDVLATQVSVMSTQFSTNEEQQIGLVREVWERQLSRTLQLGLGGGVAVTRMVVVRTLNQVLPEGDRCDDAVPRTCRDVLPVGQASLGYSDTLRGMPFRVGLRTTLQPFADRFTGNVYERLEGRLNAEWQPARRWSVRAATAAAYAVPFGVTTQAGDRIFSGEAGAQWTPEPWLSLQASGRMLWAQQPRFGSNDGIFQAVISIAATVTQTDSTAW